MKYRRMPIEIESPEEFGYGNIAYNLTESSITDMPFRDLEIGLGDVVLAYGDHRGLPELRALAAAGGAGLSADHALITTGAASALFIVATSLLAPGDRVLVAHPNYATNVETPRAIGCEVDLLPLTFENKFRVDAAELERHLTPDTKLVSLTSPHNPTGTVIAEDDLRAIVRLVERAGCYLLLDETYRDMSFHAPTPLAATLSTRAISVSSMSKSYGLPGIRIGWLLNTDPRLLDLFLAAKEQIFICNSLIDEHIALAFLERKAHFMAGITARIERAFVTVRDWIASQPYLEWVEPGGGVVCFPRIRVDANVDADRFYQILNGKYGVFVGPGHWFEQDRRHFRIGYGWPTHEQLRTGLGHITKALGEAAR